MGLRVTRSKHIVSEHPQSCGHRHSGDRLEHGHPVDKPSVLLSSCNRMSSFEFVMDVSTFWPPQNHATEWPCHILSTDRLSMSKFVVRTTILRLSTEWPDHFIRFIDLTWHVSTEWPCPHVRNVHSKLSHCFCLTYRNWLRRFHRRNRRQSRRPYS